MPKAKGMTSIEVAIIVAIVLVIAIAVGWYLYNTFASATQRSTVGVQYAVVYAVGKDKIDKLYLYLRLQPSSPGQNLEIINIEIGGKIFSCENAYITGTDWYKLEITSKFSNEINNKQIGPGQILAGRILLRDGSTALFNARIEQVDQETKITISTTNDLTEKCNK